MNILVENGTLSAWDTVTPHQRRFKSHSDGDPWRALAVSPDGKLLALGGSDSNPLVAIGVVSLLDAATGKSLRVLTGPPRAATCVAFSPDGKRLAAGDGRGTIVLWDIATGKEVIAIRLDKYAATALAYSPDGKFLAGAARMVRCT